MPNLIENYGLEILFQDTKSTENFLNNVISESKEIKGYYGLPYLFRSMGNMEFWLKTRKGDNGKLDIISLDTHGANFCVWEMLHSGFDITPKDASKLEKLVIFNKLDNTGFLPIEVINADILPSYMKNDKITMQVIALPIEINYYLNEDEYVDAQPANENGKKFLIANGSMTALDFIYNHSPEIHETGKDYQSDRFVKFTATVKELYHGIFLLDDKKYSTYIRCFAETEYGMLEFDHTLEQVPEELQKNIQVGAIISGTCIISADVAINEYNNGIIKDFEHNLKLFRYTFEDGDPERLAAVLAENAIYETDSTEKIYVGPREIIDRFNYIHETNPKGYAAHFATIISTDEQNMEFDVGTRCIVLEDRESGDYQSIAFISVNEEGLVTKLRISKDSKYHFEIDQPQKNNNPLDDCKIPDSVFEPIILRAKFIGIIDEDIDVFKIIEDCEDYFELESNAQRMLDALAENPEPDAEQALENILGYLFAKTIEKTTNENKNVRKTEPLLTASYSPSDAFKGKISSTLSGDEHIKLEKAMKYAKQFYKDFRGYVLMTEPDEEQFKVIFKQAAVVVQKIGQIYANKCFE